MDHLGFWWNGISYNNYQYLRDKYPSPAWSTENRVGSNNYSGSEVGIENKPEEKKTIRVIDNTVVFSDVSESIRSDAQTFLGRQLGLDLIGVGAFTYGACDLRDRHERKQISNIQAIFGFAVMAVGAVFSAKRLCDVANEYSKWSDRKFEEVCEQRRRCGVDIEYVRLNNFRGKVVTPVEIFRIWLKSIAKIQQDWQEATRSGQPAVNTFMQRFYSANNPFHKNIVEYVFENKKAIEDCKIVYERSVMMSKSDTYTQMMRNYHNIRMECEGEKCEITDQTNAVIAQIEEHERKVDELVSEKYNNCKALQEAVRKVGLEPYREQLAKKLEMESKDPFSSPEDKRKLESDFKKDPKVVRIEAEFEKEMQRCQQLARETRRDAERVYTGPKLQKVKEGSLREIEKTELAFSAFAQRTHTPRIDNLLGDIRIAKY